MQRDVLLLLATDDPDAGYLAGGGALHFSPQSIRHSEDLDFFHDSEERVARAFARDRARLEAAGYSVRVELSQPGHIRAVVSVGHGSTRIDWAHDSAWRFMPLVRMPDGVVLMHPVDLAVNKVLALAGRDEPRDFVDILHVDETILPLGAAVWAAAGKDPGFTPRSLLELLRRRGRYRPEEFARLSLVTPLDLVAAKAKWLQMLETADGFVRTRDPREIGCLYWSPTRRQFVMPMDGERAVAHYGRPGGVLPVVDAAIE